jgi:hypothetical protein
MVDNEVFVWFLLLEWKDIGIRLALQRQFNLKVHEVMMNYIGRGQCLTR